MRIYKEKTDIKYNDTREFFAKRAGRYKEDNPYSVTMYQDNNPELVMKRNEKEIAFLLPKLHLSVSSKVLDVACGIGRWADAITFEINKYTGIDFSSELIEIANKRNRKNNFSFYQGSATDLQRVIYKEEKETDYNIVLVMGLQIYLNDDDILTLLEQVCSVCSKEALICLREPVAIEERLTLKEFYSEDLQENYNAIYRSCGEHVQNYKQIFEKEGFKLAEGDFLYKEESLNNRKETAQYYWIYQRS